MTSIRLKIEESWYASMDCKVQKSGLWVCFYGGHSTGSKLGNHPKNIEPCAHRARTVRAPCAHRATTPPLCCCVGDCVVGHCHLYPLHSWQDILLTFAEGTFPKGNGFPKICLRLPSLLPRRQNHHPRVLPKAFHWKVESMCKSSR